MIKTIRERLSGWLSSPLTIKSAIILFVLSIAIIYTAHCFGEWIAPILVNRMSAGLKLI